MDWATFIEACVPAPHTVAVEPYAGAGGYGDTYGPSVDVEPCVVLARRRRVKVTTQDAAGAEVVSSTTVLCPPGTVAPPESRVTLPSGVVSRVLAAADHDAHGLDLPEHVELLLE